jgi:hypothetical protein
MKIRICSIAALALLVLAGCAHQPARGGSAGYGLEGYSQASDSNATASDLPDYRQVLSDPGPF